jgi:uncharacterized membrane protein YsdA (DUF1294 family)
LDLPQVIVGAAAYFGLVNLAAFAAFAWDKHCARNGLRRVRESSLLALAAIGGSPAIIAGQQALRHKTWKEPFRTNLRIVAALQVIALVALSFPQVRTAIGTIFASG